MALLDRAGVYGSPRCYLRQRRNNIKAQHRRRYKCPIPKYKDTAQPIVPPVLVKVDRLPESLPSDHLMTCVCETR